MFSSQDFKLSISILKARLVDEEIIHAGENAIGRGQVDNLKQWLVSEGHLSEEVIEKMEETITANRTGRVVKQHIPVAKPISHTPPASAAPAFIPSASPVPHAGSGQAAPAESAMPKPPVQTPRQPAAPSIPSAPKTVATAATTTRQPLPPPVQNAPKANLEAFSPAHEAEKVKTQDPGKLASLPAMDAILSSQKAASAPAPVPPEQRKHHTQSTSGNGDGSTEDDPFAHIVIDGKEHVPMEVHPRKEGGIQDLLLHARQIGASDLHIAAGSPLMARVNGTLRSLSDTAFTPEQTEHYIREALTPRQLEIFLSTGDLDFAYAFDGGGRYRANAVRQRRGLDLCFRIIHPKVPTLSELGLPQVLERLTEYHQGLVLVTGPAGCGKSTTMAAMLGLINEKRHEHMITVEDPVEFVPESNACHITQRQLGLHTRSFANALKGALRQDPDIIMIGELRDLETAGMAISAAETGHLVFSSMHTTNVTQTITRLLDLFPPGEQEQIRTMISESLRGIVSQTLVPRKDNSGVVPACEILFNTVGIGNLIRENKMEQILSAMQVGRSAGHQMIDDSLQELVDTDLISKETAFIYATHKKNFA